MSVSVGYTGQFGNNLFQYVIGRLFAEHAGLALMTPFQWAGIMPTTPPKEGIVCDGPAVRIGEDNIDSIWANPVHRNYYFEGFFQQAHRYDLHRDKIRSWFKLPDSEGVNTKDIVMHIRQDDDYGKAHRIHPDWYLEILKGETFRRLYIVTKNAGKHADYIWKFSLLSPTVISGNDIDDFHFLRSFDRILCANSTFSWWAAFLGRPSKLWTFKRWLPIPEVSLANCAGANVVDGEYLTE